MAGKDSRIPIWMTVGFALGLGFAAMFFRSSSRARPTTAAAAVSPGAPVAPGQPLRTVPNLPADGSTLSEVEGLFRTWGGYAIWDNNLTQFAVWNAETDQHSDFYEVRRVNRIYYFRTLPREDWPLIDHGVIVRCPLWFAETREMRDAYYRERPGEKPGQPIRQSLAPRAPLLPPLEPGREMFPSPVPPLTPGEAQP